MHRTRSRKNYLQEPSSPTSIASTSTLNEEPAPGLSFVTKLASSFVRILPTTNRPPSSSSDTESESEGPSFSEERQILQEISRSYAVELSAREEQIKVLHEEVERLQGSVSHWQDVSVKKHDCLTRVETQLEMLEPQIADALLRALRQAQAQPASLLASRAPQPTAPSSEVGDATQNTSYQTVHAPQDLSRHSDLFQLPEPSQSFTPADHSNVSQDITRRSANASSRSVNQSFPNASLRNSQRTSKSDISRRTEPSEVSERDITTQSAAFVDRSHDLTSNTPRRPSPDPPRSVGVNTSLASVEIDTVVYAELEELQEVNEQLRQELTRATGSLEQWEEVGRRIAKGRSKGRFSSSSEADNIFTAEATMDRWDLLEEENSTLRLERNAIEKELKQEKEMRAILATNVEELEGKLSRIHDHYDEALEDARRLQEKERTGEISRQQLLEDVGILKSEKEEMRREIEAAQARAESATAMAQELRQAAGNHHECDRALKTERDRLHELERSLEFLTGENRSAKKRVSELERASAAMELELSRKAKKIEADAEELDNLAIALQTKQQELEMVKRTFGVRGTGGSTPAVRLRDDQVDMTPGPFRTPAPLAPRLARASLGTPSIVPSSSLRRLHPRRRPLSGTDDNIPSSSAEDAPKPAPRSAPENTSSMATPRPRSISSGKREPLRASRSSVFPRRSLEGLFAPIQEPAEKENHNSASGSRLLPVEMSE